VIHLGNHGLELVTEVEELATEAEELVTEVQELVTEEQVWEKELDAANLCNTHSLPIASPGNQTSDLLRGTVVHHSQSQCCHLSHTWYHTVRIVYHQAAPECNHRIHLVF